MTDIIGTDIFVSNRGIGFNLNNKGELSLESILRPPSAGGLAAALVGSGLEIEVPNKAYSSAEKLIEYLSKYIDENGHKAPIWITGAMKSGDLKVASGEYDNLFEKAVEIRFSLEEINNSADIFFVKGDNDDSTSFYLIYNGKLIRMKKVEFEKKSYNQFYQNPVNSFFWPLAHLKGENTFEIVKGFPRPKLRKDDYSLYTNTDNIFAHVILNEIKRIRSGKKDTEYSINLRIDDYQLMNVGCQVQKLFSDEEDSSEAFGEQSFRNTGFFNHIPVPDVQAIKKLLEREETDQKIFLSDKDRNSFAYKPAKKIDEPLKAVMADTFYRMLTGHSMLGFHTKEYVENFVDLAQYFFGSENINADFSEDGFSCMLSYNLNRNEDSVLIGTFPIGIDLDWAGPERFTEVPELDYKMKRVVRRKNKWRHILDKLLCRIIPNKKLKPHIDVFKAEEHEKLDIGNLVKETNKNGAVFSAMGRSDYTKNFHLAVEGFGELVKEQLEKYKDPRENGMPLHLLLLTAPSRMNVEAYRNNFEILLRRVEEINKLFENPEYEFGRGNKKYITPTGEAPIIFAPERVTDKNKAAVFLNTISVYPPDRDGQNIMPMEEWTVADDTFEKFPYTIIGRDIGLAQTLIQDYQDQKIFLNKDANREVPEGVELVDTRSKDRVVQMKKAMENSIGKYASPELMKYVHQYRNVQNWTDAIMKTIRSGEYQHPYRN
ncbi:hypothetical protein GF327_01005 [Candidatus Woesearchaeota archaeon]|nr:hypothetical protein [Candidatus Woesearchaeota archaeon]